MTQQTTPAASAPPTPLIGALILAGLIVAASGYIYLNVTIGNQNYWAGFLFLTFWMATEQVQPGSFASCAAGAVAGLSIALALQVLPQAYGAIGEVAALGLMLIAIYMQIVGWAKIVINFSTMIFLTAGAAVPMQTHVRIIDALPPLAIGIVYFGGLILGGQKIAERRAAKAAA